MIPSAHQPPDYRAFVNRSNDEAVLAWLLALRARFRTVNTLGLPGTDERTDFPVEQLYVPLAVQAQDQPHTELERLLVDSRRLLLLGPAGCGKSTFVTWLCWKLAHRGRNEVHGRVGELVPLPFILRDLPITEQVDSWDALLALLQGTELWTPQLDALLPTLLASGQALIVFDGWDEVADVTLRRALRRAVADAMSRFPRAAFLLTSRPEGWRDATADQALVSVTATVQPFDDDQGRALIDAWYRWRLPELARGRTQGLWSQIDADPHLRQLAASPYHLTMLALMHGRVSRLPRTEVELLGSVADAFVQDFAPSDASALAPLAARTRWLSELALTMNRRRVWGATRDELAELSARDPAAARRVERLQSGTVITWQDAERLMRDAAEDEGPTQAVELLQWCLRRSGLVVLRETDRMAFAHLAIQDWFAAMALRRRLAEGWVEPDVAHAAARELRRWALRAAGGDTVRVVLLRLRQTLPAVADQLAVEVFAERAATPVEHRRLLALADALDELDKLLPDMAVVGGRAVEVGPDEELPGDPDLDAVYLLDRPDLNSLAALAALAVRPAQQPTRRTLYLRETGVTEVPAGLPWRVVDEFGVVYTPEEGVLRVPHERPA